MFHALTFFTRARTHRECEAMNMNNMLYVFFFLNIFLRVRYNYFLTYLHSVCHVCVDSEARTIQQTFN